MKGKKIQANILSTVLIPNGDPDLLKSLNVPEGYRSLGLITTDIDDISYVALDEATKNAEVEVVYADSMYAGAANASTKLAGEFIGVLAGPDPEAVKSGIGAMEYFIENEGFFYSANDEETIPYFAHCVSRPGKYLSELADTHGQEAIAYLIAPPSEAIYGIDQALKMAEVTLKVFYGPPSHTNFAGALLAGSQEACRAACEAFAEAVCQVAAAPLMI